MVTTNLAEFGRHQRELAAELLSASCEQGFPDDFSDGEVQIIFDTLSGHVFFTNAERQICAMNGGNLETWHITPCSRYEGFANELREKLDGTWEEEDVEYLRDAGIITEEEFGEMFAFD